MSRGQFGRQLAGKALVKVRALRGCRILAGYAN
jgi:hypothetical protein